MPQTVSQLTRQSCKKIISKCNESFICTLCNATLHRTRRSPAPATKASKFCHSCRYIFPFYNLTNAELIDLFKPSMSFTADTFNQLFSEVEVLSNNNTDFDDNILGTSTNILSNCYVSADEVKINLSSTNKTNNIFSTLCFTVRSLLNPHNFTKFQGLIASLGYMPDVIGVTETWENSSGPFKSVLVMFISLIQ